MVEAAESHPYASQPAEPAAAQRASLDEPMDAIVYDEHPAVATKPKLVLSLHDLYHFFHLQTEPAKYKVPPRFGMSAILGIVTALAILFGAFRFLNAEPVVYLFFGIQSLVICLVQMFNGKSPRAASVIVGFVMVPFFAVRLVEAADLPVPYYTSERLMLSVVLIPLTAPLGALLGYLTGACAAGIFLVMDYLEHYFENPSLASPPAARSAG